MGVQAWACQSYCWIDQTPPSPRIFLPSWALGTPDCREGLPLGQWRRTVAHDHPPRAGLKGPFPSFPLFLCPWH